jgi:hypothetical protein
VVVELGGDPLGERVFSSDHPAWSQTMTVRDVFEAIQGIASFSEARRHIFTGHVKFNGEQITSMGQEIDPKQWDLFRVGKQVWQFDSGRWIKLVKLETGREYHFDLHDISDGPEQPFIEGKLRFGGRHEPIVMIGAEGYGEKTAADGAGFPVVVEFHEGKFRVLVWSDIDEEDPTHIISLEGAREDARQSDEP